MLVNPERFAHGTRARYVAGKCRCEPCRTANRNYARARARGEHNGVVDSSAARAHLEVLRAAGVGTRAVSAAADVGRTALMKILAGTPVRASIVRRVLSVDAGAISDRALVSAKPTTAAVREMLRLGLTKTEVAHRLGYAHALQFNGRRVTARNELRVKKLLAMVRAEVCPAYVCLDCGEEHSPERRQAWLLRVETRERDVLHDERPCWWPSTDAGRRMLERDIAAIRERAA